MPTQTRAMCYGLAAVLCWSTVATAFKLGLAHLHPAQMLLVASATASVFFVLALAWQQRLGALLRQPTAAVLRSFGFGLLNPFLYYLILFSAYDRLPAQEAQVLNYSWAIVMTLLAVPLLRQSLRRSDCVAAVLCYLGVWVIATRGKVLSIEFADLTGVMLALASTVIWALYWIFNRRDQREPMMGLCLNFLLATPLVAMYCAWNGLLVTLPWQGVVSGLYVGLVEMGLGFLFWLQAMKLTTSTARIANLIFISPFLSLILIATILGEAILPSTLLALLLIVAGLAVQNFSSKPLTSGSP